LEVLYGYPVVVNNSALTHAFRALIERRGDIVVVDQSPTMGGEDFSYFAERAPGVLVRLGVRNEAAGIVHAGHSPEFRIDEAALPVGVETLVAFARGVGAGELLP
jgi:amidohydrolase